MSKTWWLFALTLTGTALADAPRGEFPPIEGRPRSFREEKMDTPEKYVDAPADPWAAVDGDQPKRRTEEQIFHWRLNETKAECTAARDHCLPALTWMLERDEWRDDKTLDRHPIVVGFGPKGPLAPGNNSVHEAEDGKYTLYRSVPATKKNLVPGALAIWFGERGDNLAEKQTRSGEDAYTRRWNMGVVDKVDWEMGFVQLAGREDPWWITSTRVAVLSWRPGGKVTVLGGAKKGDLAVKRSEVTLP